MGSEAACSMQIYNLSMLEERLKAMYRSVTEGRFSEALRQVNTILHIIPLTVVDSRREVDEVKELISIARSVPRGGQGGQAGLGFRALLLVAVNDGYLQSQSSGREGQKKWAVWLT